MGAGRRRTTGLATRIVRVTLLVGAFTVLTASYMAVNGASRLASEQVAARDRASLQLVQDDILGRFVSVERAASAVAEQAATAKDSAVLKSQLRPVFDSSDSVISRIVVADYDGRLVAVIPASADATAVQGNAVFREALAGATGFRRTQASDGAWSLWLTRSATTPRGAPVVVMIQVQTKFLQQTVESAATSVHGEITVLEGAVALVRSSATDASDFSRATWRPVSTSAGEVSAPTLGGRQVQGYYSDLRGIEGIDWRVAILEPSTLVMGDTVQAVAPTILVLLLGGFLGVTAALLFSQRLVRPLKRLEDTAYRAAKGSFVKPIPADTDDEIGQVADAFNAVALRLNALHDLSQLLASASQRDQVLDGILSAMRHIVGPGVAAIYLLDDDDEEWLVPARSRGVDVASVRRVATTGDGWLAHALHDAEVVVHSSDIVSMQANLPGLSSDQTVALTAPLLSGHSALGVIVVLRRQNEPVTEAEREMVRTFSAQAAVAVHNSRLFEAETESLRVAEVLRTVAERLVKPGKLADALGDIEVVVDELFGTTGATFAIIDRSVLSLPPAVDRESERRLLTLARRLLGGRASGATVVHFGDDAESDAVMTTLDGGALLIAPVATDSKHGAFLVVPLWRTQVSGRDTDLVVAVANEVALALDNAYLFERAVTRATNLETVFRISQAVGSSLQVNVVLNRVLDVVQKILSADAVALMTFDARKRAIVTAMARGAVPPGLVTLEVMPGEDIPGYVFSTGEPAVLRDLDVSMGGVAGQAAQSNMKSMIAVPLLARGRSIGVLTVFSVDAEAFSDEDMNVLQTFASQAALALDTARLYSREHEVASILQQSILPDELPVYPEIESASVYQPAGAEAEIGGDYYDLFRSPDGAIWFAIADVCGKGVTAATKTSMIKYSVRAFVAAGLAPAAVLGEVNRFVAEAGDTSDIVTLWVGKLDPSAGTLSYASGGHPPGVIKHADGSFDLASPTGPLLGALADVVYGERAVEFGEGDTIVLYTDGVTEARSGKEFFGEERVQKAVALGGSAEEIVRRLLTLVRRWVHGELRDDVALLAIALRPRQSEHT